MSDRVTIKIPRKLHEKLKDMIADSGFSSVTELIVYVMRSLASEKKIAEDGRLSAEEVRAIRARLVKLGYLEDSSQREV